MELELAEVVVIVGAITVLHVAGVLGHAPKLAVAPQSSLFAPQIVTTTEWPLFEIDRPLRKAPKLVESVIVASLVASRSGSEKLIGDSPGNVPTLLEA